MCMLENTVSITISYKDIIITSFSQDFKNAKREENMAEIQVLISLKPVEEEFIKDIFNSLPCCYSIHGITSD